MQTVTLPVNGKLVTVWLEGEIIVAAKYDDKLALDSYAELEDIESVYPGGLPEALNIDVVVGLSSVPLRHYNKVFKFTDTGDLHVAVEEAYQVMTLNNDELVFKAGTLDLHGGEELLAFDAIGFNGCQDIVGIVFEGPVTSICFATSEEHIKTVKSVCTKEVRHFYINNFNLGKSDSFAQSVEELKRELMETLKTPIAQVFTGSTLKALVEQYGGRSKFQRKKRIRVTKERLESITHGLSNGFTISDGIRLQDGAFIQAPTVIKTINTFLPQDMHVDANTDSSKVQSHLKEIIPLLDTIKDYRYEA